MSNQNKAVLKMSPIVIKTLSRPVERSADDSICFDYSNIDIISLASLSIFVVVFLPFLLFSTANKATVGGPQATRSGACLTTPTDEKLGFEAAVAALGECKCTLCTVDYVTSPVNLVRNQVPFFFSRLFTSLWVPCTGSASDWRALQETV